VDYSYGERNQVTIPYDDTYVPKIQLVARRLLVRQFLTGLQSAN
jgi:hypothetical protein